MLREAIDAPIIAALWLNARICASTTCVRCVSAVRTVSLTHLVMWNSQLPSNRLLYRVKLIERPCDGIYLLCEPEFQWLFLDTWLNWPKYHHGITFKVYWYILLYFSVEYQWMVYKDGWFSQWLSTLYTINDFPFCHSKPRYIPQIYSVGPAWSGDTQKKENMDGRPVGPSASLWLLLNPPLPNLSPSKY